MTNQSTPTEELAKALEEFYGNTYYNETLRLAAARLRLLDTDSARLQQLYERCIETYGDLPRSVQRIASEIKECRDARR